MGILYILNTVLCTCWILNSWQLFLNPVASLFWCGKCHPWGIQIKMSWDICNVCLSVGKKNISWVTSIWKSNNIICTVNSQVKYKYCQISIFEIKMMVKIGVIFMPFLNPTCHFRATADFTICTVCTLGKVNCSSEMASWI